MRDFALVCAGLALVAGIIASKLWLELRAERGQTASLRTQVVELRTVASLSAPPRQLPVPQPRAEAANLPAAQATTQAAGAATAATAAIPVGVGSGALRQQEMLKDPAYREALVAQTRTNLMMQYPGLAEELGLTPDEAGQLFNLLAENQVEMSGTMILPPAVNGIVPDRTEANRRRRDLQHRQEQSLQSLLGSSRYGQWQEYQQTLGPRQQVMQLGRTFEAMGIPLAAEQTRPLTAAFVAAQRRQSEEMLSLAGSGPMTAANRQQRMDAQLRLLEESNRRRLEAARAHLTARQLAAFQESLEQQLVMERALRRAELREMESRGTGGAPPPEP